MQKSLGLIFERLLDEVDSDFYRYLYSSFNINNRLTGLVGPRGVGKTTLLLQYIKNKCDDRSKVFYFSADHIYFNDVTIYQFVEDLVLTEGIELFFIDEIHRYKNWNQELKNLYDAFPSLKIVFSGSSSLDLIKGSYDLSRRAKLYRLPGLSFREYLNFSQAENFPIVDFSQLLLGKMPRENISNFPKLLGHFKQYLQQGFYPFFMEDALSYYEKILSIVEKTIYEDIANFYQLKTTNLRYFSKILRFLSTIPPGKISTYNISKNMGIDDKTAANYLNILHETGLVEVLYPAETGNVGLRKPEKAFLSNTNLHYALQSNALKDDGLGTIRELFFVQSIKGAGLEILHSKAGDYQIDDAVFEIGGKNKTTTQIKGQKNAFLVKDDILLPSHKTIPLPYFGFIY